MNNILNSIFPSTIIALCFFLAFAIFRVGIGAILGSGIVAAPLFAFLLPFVTIPILLVFVIMALKQLGKVWQ